MKKSRLDPEVIRVDDMVEIVIARRVKRVGYPKTVADYMAELEPRLKDDINAVINSTVSAQKVGLVKDAYDKILRELGYLAAKADGFGGPRRSLHCVDMPAELVGHRSRVDAVKTVQTGTYQKAEYHRGGWGYSGYDEDEYWPPHLVIDKVYRLARIYVPSTGFQMIGRGAEETWLPVEFLRKVHSEQ